ncbi:hypothetical protein I2I05_16605 [Hymenobacter sp. BT683]|uniref:Aromatic hydrocarbon degradation protein n=1 Tax=Hymenobacter jeongseonensis TaxID=2791027 RepID=A0ABS0IKX2_9BACT|nr:hypothetical protein [Hymenobacter jeongseonensis]MBF9239025.1 hypothetical protein [Hymenobacter jeongseonensis]
MKKRIIWLSLALVAGQAGHAFAQGPADALRYSRLQFGGPARTLGIGGANVALGADFGNLTSNPAGLGMYQKSELHFTPGIGFGQSNASIDGSSSGAQEATKNSFHIASGGLVFTTRRPDDDQTTNWRAGSFALGFTRLADFNTASSYQGTINNNQSFLSRLQPEAGARGQAFFDDLDGQFDANDYETNLGLAYGAYLADIVRGRNGLDSAVVLRRQGSVLNQGETVTNSGSVSQFDLGYGASYRDRLYIGGALGIVNSKYTEVRVLTETDDDPNTYFNGLRSRSELTTRGTGINARLGLIYRATDKVRVGASVQTPTFTRLNDTYNENLTSDFSGQGTDRVPVDLPVGETTVNFPSNDYAYTLTSPFRANGGVAVTLGKYGFVTGDVEYVNYGQARLRNDSEDVNGDDYSFSAENSEIQARYQSAVNLRVGGEARFDIFRARLGFARYGDPYNEDAELGRAQNYYTGGLGIRQGNFFLDAAAVYTTFNQAYTPYSLPNNLQPYIKVDNNRFTTSVTAGITF